MPRDDSGSPSSPTAFHRVADARQARLLTDETVLRFFEPFLARERTVGEAAAEAGCKPSVMLYRVGRLVDAGLLRIVRERKRAGRPLKVYRSSHDAYVVPYELTPFATVEEAFYEGFEANARRLARLTARRYRGRAWDGYRLYRTPSGTPWMEGAPIAEWTPDSVTAEGPGLDFTIDLRLTEAEARALQGRLVDFLRDHRSRDDAPREGRPFVLSVAFVPDDVDDA